MKIYTSYFAKLKSLPPDIVPIAICAKLPNWYTGKCYKKVAPKYGFFMQWKQNHDNARYTALFKKEVLAELKFVDVISELFQISSGKDIALICYEKPGDFCHRHIVADWVNEWLRLCNIGVEGNVIEWK